jgi:hypothetical protein
MARGFISVTNTGLTEIADYLDKLGDEYQEIVQQSVVSMQEVVVERIKVNWTTMIGGETSGYVYNSIGKSTATSKNDKNIVLGTMGVYNIDSVNSTYGKTPKDLNAAQIAYWIEYGTSRLRSGGRKKKGQEYSDEDLITVAAKPFISNAFYTSVDEQNNAFSIKFNELVDRIK